MKRTFALYTASSLLTVSGVASFAAADVSGGPIHLGVDDTKIDLDGDGRGDFRFTVEREAPVQEGGRAGWRVVVTPLTGGAGVASVLAGYTLRMQDAVTEIDTPGGVSLADFGGEVLPGAMLEPAPSPWGGGGGGYGGDGGYGGIGGGWGGGRDGPFEWWRLWSYSGVRWVVEPVTLNSVAWVDGAAALAAMTPEAGVARVSYIPVQLEYPGGRQVCGWVEYTVSGDGSRVSDHRLTAAGIESGYEGPAADPSLGNDGVILAGDRGCTFGAPDARIWQAPDAGLLLSAGDPMVLSADSAERHVTGYQWLRNGVALADDAAAGISGVATAQLAVAAVSARNAGVYTLRICNRCGWAESAALQVQVRTTAPTRVEPLRVVDGLQFGKTYGLLPAGTWRTAVDSATLLGGRLVEIQSAAENEFIRQSMLADAEDRHAWIGLSDALTEGSFRWTSGSTAAFRNWYPGEPNEANGGEDCVEMYPDGRWNDLFWFASYPYAIVELPRACPADVGGSGGVAPPDGALDTNDFIAMVDMLLMRDPRADLGSTGASFGSDGVWDTNDLVVFCELFFRGCH